MTALPRWLSGKEFDYQCRRHRNRGFSPWVRKIPWRRKRQPAQVFVPGEVHGQRDLASYSPWVLKAPDPTEHACIQAMEAPPKLENSGREASELSLLLTVRLGLNRHIRTAGFGVSKDTIDPQCLSASQLSSSPRAMASHSGSTRRQGNYSGSSLPGLTGKEELLVTAQYSPDAQLEPVG